MNRVHEHNGRQRTPRAQRYRFDVPLQYRTRGAAGWRQSLGANISRSGVLFETDEAVAVHTRIEICFQIPARVSGEPAATVICQGRVVRQMASDGTGLTVAATIDAYRLERSRVSLDRI